jgi:predicted Holliday junction resolvase-like endonuclease
MKVCVVFIYILVLCLYRNWVYTEEISYTYHDKSGRLYNTVEETTHQYPAAGREVHEFQQLQEAQKKIKELEKRIGDLEKRIPQRYPDVKYLNYRSRKRILVSIKTK